MRQHLLTRASIALLLWAALLGSGSCARESAPGEVMLWVSTDLSIPTDADTLQIAVKRAGDGAPLSCEFYQLGADVDPSSGTKHLPGSLALVSSEATHGFVQVHLELLRGGCDPALCAGCRDDGSTGVVRVQRDAELEIPNQGVKELPMPLDLLCAEGSPPTPCPPGTTCHVGECVSDKTPDTSRLSDYVPKAPSACLDVPSCFADISSANTTVPEPDPALGGRCSVKNSAVQGAVNVNVALVVNTSVVGNYGVCDASSAKCLVPLDHGPTGWQTISDSNNVPVAIGLPEAVCRAVGKSVLGVTISRASTNCVVSSAVAGVCPKPDVCVTASGLACPTGWARFSCGTAPYPGLALRNYCGQVGTAPTTGPVVPGLWCCNQNEPAMQTDPLLIDDMSSGPLIKLAPPDANLLPGNWFTGGDDINAVLSPPVFPRSLFTYRAIEPPARPAAGPTISRAACLSEAHGIKGYVALEGFNFFIAPPNFDPVTFNVTPYTGISFWAYAEPGKIVDEAGEAGVSTKVRVTFPDVDTFTEVDTLTENTSTCITNASRDKCDHFGKLLTLTKDWVHYFVRWDELVQSGFGYPIPNGFNPTKVYATGFEFQGPGPTTRSMPFDFCVAQIEFTRD